MDDIQNTQEAHVTNAATEDALVYMPKDIERLLCLSKNSVNALLRSGQLRAVRYGRKWLIPRSAVEEFLNGQSKGGKVND